MIVRLAQRFYDWYWRGWFDDLEDDHPVARFVWWLEERFLHGESLGNLLAARWVCPSAASAVELDNCGIPEHAYCHRCNGICGRTMLPVGP